MSDDSDTTQGSGKYATHSEEWTLYMLTAVMPASPRLPAYGDSTHVYAHDEVHAQLRAQSWIELHQHCSSLEIKAYPEGFTIHTRSLSGKITVEVKEGSNGK
jgi:hypothetical protein